MTDYKQLCARMANELDHYRQLVTDDRRETHALATEARAALAEPEPEGPTQRQLLQLAAEFWPEGCEPTQAAPYSRAVLARWGRPAPQPIPVSERPPELEDCDAEGRCWWFCFECPGEHSYWIFAKEVYCVPRLWLPARALPLPTNPDPQP